MKFNPAAFAGGFTGGIIAGNTGDDYEVLPSVAGAVIGGFAGTKFNAELPNGLFDTVKTQIDTSSGVTSYRRTKSDYLSQLTDVLTNASKGVAGDTPFDPANPMSSITETNLKSAVRYYEQVGDTELKKALLILREGEEAVVKFDPEALAEGYKVQYDFVKKGATLEDKVATFSEHLMSIETQNVPLANQTPAMEAQRAARVEELKPLLNRLEGNIIFEDGQLKSVLAGQSFTMPLTQTLTDGETLGHNINNNVYTSHKFNIMGSVIAAGLGKDDASASQIADQMGLKAGSLEHNNVKEMLVNKTGLTREATVGILASTEGVTDEGLLASINRLSDKMQWDEHATSLHLEAKTDAKLGFTDDYRNSSYTKTQAELIDMQTTIKHGAGGFGDLSEKPLRNVQTSTENGKSGVESHKIRREMKALGEDRVSGVKADHSLLFTPYNNSEGGLVNINNPYNRNTGTVTNRSLSVTVKEGSAFNSVDDIVQIFGGERQLGSAVQLRTALFDEKNVSEGLSAVFGSNITLADGYAIGNQANFSNFEHEGYKTVKMHAGMNNEVTLRSPMMNHIATNQLSVEDVKELADTHLNFKAPRKATLEKANLNFAKAIEHLDNGGSIEDLVNVLEPKYKGLSKMLKGVQRSTEKEALSRLSYEEDELTAYKNRAIRQGVVDYFGGRASIAKDLETTDYGRGIIQETNAKLYSARANFLQTGDMDAFKSELAEATDFYQGKRDVLRDAYKTAYPKGGTVVGFGVSGEAQALSKSYDGYELMAVDQRVDPQGRVSLEATYKGTTNVGDNAVVKTFSVNYKDQNILVDRHNFAKAGVLAELLDTGVAKFENGKFSLGDQVLTPEEMAKHLEESSSEYKGLYDKYLKVDSMSSLDNAGYKNHLAIEEAIRSKATSSLIPQNLQDTINSYGVNKRQDVNVVQGLKDFVYATSNEKPSLSSLVESVTSAQLKIQELNDSYRAGIISKDTYITRTLPYTKNLDSRRYYKTEKIIESVTDSFNTSVAKLAHHYSTVEGAYELQTDENVRREVADIFINNAKIADRGNNSNIHTSIAAINRKAVTETGAGTFDKAMSWNAQTQLLANGYTKDELSMFASFDKAAVNDAQALTGMTRKHDTLLNKHFQANSSVMRNVMNAAPENRRAMLEDAFGYKTNSDVDFYDLHYKPKTGIRSIPLIYDESRGFDSYVDTKDTGAKRGKRINSLMTDIIEADINLRNATDVDDINSLQNRLEDLHGRLEKAVKPTLGGSSGAIKAAMTRHGDASHLATVGAFNGQISSFLAQEQDAGRSASYAGVSYHGALDRLKLAGVELTSEEEKEFLQGKGKYLQDVEGFGNLKRIMVNDDTPLFGFINREPAQGPMSIRAAEYLLDSSIYNSEGSRSSLFIKSEDPIYKYLQFGDYDFDSMTEYFANSSSKQNAVMMQSVLEKGRQNAKDYSELYDLAKSLGVKNNKSDSVKSLFDILAENPEIKTFEQWHEKYLDTVYDDTTRAGLRKTISPKVTMLAAHLNNSLMSSTNDLSGKNIQAGRVLSHYFVENLLKAQHSTEEAGGETVAERLTRLREMAVKGSPDAYLDELTKGLTDQLKNLEPNSKEYQLGQDAIDAIVKAERTHMTKTALNPMDISGAMIGKTFKESLELAEDVYEGKTQAIGLHKTVKVDADIADYAKVGYDRFKTTAKQLFHNNKKVLGYSAAGLAGVAIAFRDNPDEAYKQSATADVGRQTLAPNKMEAPVEGQTSGSPSEYVTPHRDARRAVTVEGQHVGRREDARYNAQKSIFGDSIESAQVEYRE